VLPQRQDCAHWRHSGRSGSRLKAVVRSADQATIHANPERLIVVVSPLSAFGAGVAQSAAAKCAIRLSELLTSSPAVICSYKGGDVPDVALDLILASADLSE
jgi:hypothetical protein